MRNLFALLALLGLVGIGLGVVTILRGATAIHGLPFNYESYGGPGSILAGLIMLLASLYLRATWPSRE